MNRKSNVLIFFTDDQRFDTIHALGNPQIRTPHLDELVSSGTAFTHAHIPGGTCGAVCMPSRAMLHSGRTLFHIDGMGEGIPASHVTLGECLQRAGYAAFGTGKWHNGTDSYARSFSAGAEIFFDGMGDHWNVPACRFDPTGKYDVYRPYIRDARRSNKLDYWHCDHIQPGRHSTDLFVDAAIDFTRNRDSSIPYLMYVSLMAPHDPRTMPQRFLELYDPAKIELPPNFMPEHSIDTGALRVRDELLAAFPRDPGEIRRHIAEYYAMISHLDEAFGRLIDTLRQQGDLDNTILVFAGDNGLALGRHGLMGKQNLYEHSVRVPLVFAGPGIPRGQRRETPVYLMDIFPTLCDLTDTKIPGSVEGRSLMPCFGDSSVRPREFLYLAYERSIRGVSDTKYKLVEYAGGATQFFDLVRDPLEMRNLADDPSSKADVARMRQKMLELADELDDEKHPCGRDFWMKRADLKSRRG